MKKVEVGQIWKRKNFMGGFDYLIVRNVISNGSSGLREKYCEVTNVQNLTEYKDWIFPDDHELMNGFVY